MLHGQARKDLRMTFNRINISQAESQLIKRGRICGLIEGRQIQVKVLTVPVLFLSFWLAAVSLETNIKFKDLKKETIKLILTIENFYRMSTFKLWEILHSCKIKILTSLKYEITYYTDDIRVKSSKLFFIYLFNSKLLL